jgi:hypothetical protein
MDNHLSQVQRLGLAHRERATLAGLQLIDQTIQLINLVKKVRLPP